MLLAERRYTRELAAIKCLKKGEVLAREELDSMATEKTVFRKVTAASHPFLVHLYATFQTEASVQPAGPPRAMGKLGVEGG